MSSNGITMLKRGAELLTLSGSIILLAILAVALIAIGSQASTGAAAPSPHVNNLRPVHTAEVKKIAGKLMAPCCWSQTADVHTSDTAKKIQAQIREALDQGYSEKQILAAFVTEYGERILARPTASGFNLMVWILPIVALGAGGMAFWRFVQHAHARPAPKPKRTTRAEESYSERFERELAEFE